MFTKLKNSILSFNENGLKPYYKLLDQINALESQLEHLSDEELQQKTTYFKEQLQSGAKIEEIRVEAFAVVREAAKRVLGLRHYDVQILGGLALSDGNISEMPTGEGKTLVASLPSYLRALEGKGVHVITVNEYLARRDFEQIGKIHRFLGLTVGLNVPLMETEEKKQAYHADITYGVGTEFGFDYLRDNMVMNAKDKVQRPFHYAIIDEIDSVLIDEAKTPLIVAGKTHSSSDLYYISATLVKRFKQDTHYTYDPETKTPSLTDQGIELIESVFDIENLYDLEHQILYHHVIQALRAMVSFKRDVDYIIKDGKIMLVDMFTGRVMEGRSLSDGLHQAIEAKEGLEITAENKTQASITVQNYFRKYPILSGMTGTAKTDENEFRQVYGMNVFQIPTNKPKQRIDLPDRVFMTKKDKYTAVTNEVIKRHKKGQPVLIGTTSILQSEEVATYLKKKKLKFELLNAKSIEQEAEIIKEAGKKGKIMIATNMAGRGTDIILGEGVAELGGLHVIGTEKHESRRIDDQLRGRSGRQGDPGSSQFFISLEDDMFTRFAKEELEKIIPSLQTNDEGLIVSKKINDFVLRTQRIVEGFNYSIREFNLKLDDVINEQSHVIYKVRNNVLESENQIHNVLPMIESAIWHSVETHCDPEELFEDWPIEALERELSNIIPIGEVNLQNIEDEEDIHNRVKEYYRQYEEILNDLEKNERIQHQLKHVLLSTIDLNWVYHLENMTRLKEGIGLRSYQQEDPMRLYQKDALELFTKMYRKIEKETSIRTAYLIRQINDRDEQKGKGE